MGCASSPSAPHLRGLRPFLAVWAALTCISCGQPEPGDTSVPLAPVVTSRAPLSDIPYVRLVSEDVGCVIDSFEVRIHCIHRSGRAVGVFGQSGEGPGEFRTPLFLVRGPNETVGVVDIGLSRMSVFEPTGAFTFQVSLPGTIFTPASSGFSSTLVGTYFQRNGTDRGLGSRQGELDIASEEVVWERVYPTGLRTDAGCEPAAGIGGLTDGVASQDRSFAFPACNGHLILFRDRDQPQGLLVRAPLYAPEFPNAWEMEDYRAAQRSAARTGGFAPPGSEDEYARTPKPYTRMIGFDERDRLWVLTNRDRLNFSYLDIYSDTTFLGSVRIRGRADGFDVLGSTMAVLVDRPASPGGLDVIPDREIDWYDISRIDFGAAAREAVEDSLD